MRNIFVSKLVELAESDNRINLLTADLGYGVLDPFIDKFPDRYFNVGIAEQALTGIAAGMALSKKIAVTYSIANFPTLRCLEQIRNDCLYHDANVKIVSVGAGFTYGALGMSHHATEDVGVLRALPNITIFTPSDPVETEHCVKLMMELNGTSYLRLGRGGEKLIHDDSIVFNIGESIECINGDGIAFLVSGPIAVEVKEALLELRTRGYNPGLYTFPTLKPFDTNRVKQVASKYKNIITVEEGSVIGGLFSCVIESLVNVKFECKIHRLGINDCYTSEVGDQAYLRKVNGIDSESIINYTIAYCNE